MSKLKLLLRRLERKEQPSWLMEFKALEDDKASEIGGRFWYWIDQAMGRISKDELFTEEWRVKEKNEKWSDVMAIAAKLREQGYDYE